MLCTASDLLGIELDDGWKVVEKIKPRPENTGGHFSVGYKVQKDEKFAFLKAIDFTAANEQPDPEQFAKSILDSFIFERDLLQKCNKKKLSKIVTAIGHGVYIPKNATYFFERINYIIFEFADGNIRNHLQRMKYFDLAWVLRSLHSTAIGLDQLHKNKIAHQDLKPSNVLIINKTSKIGDLGRSHDESVNVSHDKYMQPGDRTYYPPDTFYNNNNWDKFHFKVATDLYLLGSLIFSYFFKLSLKDLLIIELKKQDLLENLSNDFYADLPYFQISFEIIIHNLEKEINKISPKIARELIPLIKMLCELDPYKRGFNKNIELGTGQYSLERFISKFDLLANQAEHKFYE